jgi:hypothetical protein
MAHVAIYILATDKNTHRLQAICHGGIRGKKNNFTVILMGEGKKPDFLTKNMKWLAWDKYRVTDKHILAFDKGILVKEADYHVFCDDDSFVDIDNMVESLDAENIKNSPCYWSQPGMGLFIKDINSIVDFFSTRIKKKSDFENLKSSWIGWSWAVVNKAFAKVAQKSKESKLVLEYSLTLNQFIPDFQICILGSLIKAKHFYNPAPAATQWKDYFHYSGIVKDAPLWLIHYTIDNKILNYNDLISTVKKGPQKIDDAIYSMFASQFTKGIKPKHFINKKFIKKYFFVYWGYHAWHHPVQDDACKGIIIPRRDGKITLENSNKEWSWKENKKGITIYNEHNSPISELRWKTENGLIGKNLLHNGRVLDLFETA